MNGAILIIAGLVLLLVVSTFRNGLSDGLYSIQQHWRQALFTAAFILIGVVAGLKSNDIDVNVPTPSFDIKGAAIMLTHKQPELDKTIARIYECKSFVLAQRDKPETLEQKQNPVVEKLIKVSGQSNWDKCAKTFGMNYWRHDIAIGEENGGHVLCETYKNSIYRSSNVDAWCSTVFAPPEEKAPQADGEPI